MIGFQITFLDESTHLYKRVCLSDGPLVGPYPVLFLQWIPLGIKEQVTVGTTMRPGSGLKVAEEEGGGGGGGGGGSGGGSIHSLVSIDGPHEAWMLSIDF